MAEITLTDDIQVAHRLTGLPGKCQQIHGHSMVIELSIYCGVDATGYALGEDGEIIEFGEAKKVFRAKLAEWDHHLLLNENDPWASQVVFHGDIEDLLADRGSTQTLPGLVRVPEDPSVENMALWLAQVFAEEFHSDVSVCIHETKSNSFRIDWKYTDDRSMD